MPTPPSNSQAPFHQKLLAVPGLLRTPEGRDKVATGVSHLLRPVTFPAARLYRKVVLRNTRIVAVTGSFGKTTTKAVLAAALKDRRRNRTDSLTKAVFKVPPGTGHAVFELGIDRPGQMAPMATMLAPDIAVVTTIGSEHLTSMRSIEVTRDEKAWIVRALRTGGVAVLNGDDPNVMWMASQTRERVITYGLGESNDVYAADITLEWPRGLTFRIHAGGESCRIRTRFLGRHFILAFLAAAAVSSAEGIALPEFVCRAEQVRPVNGRMSVKPLDNGAVLLCDYFKSPYETMHSALDTLAEAPARRRVVVFGDISEPPGTPAGTYGVLGERLAGIADKAVFLGRNFPRYRAGAVRGGMSLQTLVYTGDDMEAAAAAIRDGLEPGDVVLIKGRGEQRLDRIVLLMEGRKVGCKLTACWLKNVRCESCSMLERGWDGLTPVT